MINIYYGSKKICLKGSDCKFDKKLPEVKLNDSDIEIINSFLKEETGPDVEIEAINYKNGTSFSKLFRNIDAAGGLIKNDKGEYLFIFRRNKWDLPKGKVDAGENIEEAAIREVKEECGLKKVNVNDFLTCTFHIYHLKGKFILKSTHWFLMNAPGNQKLTPQTEEDITDIMWMKADNVKKIMSNTFPSILDVINLI